MSLTVNPSISLAKEESYICRSIANSNQTLVSIFINYLSVSHKILYFVFFYNFINFLFAFLNDSNYKTLNSFASELPYGV